MNQGQGPSSRIQREFKGYSKGEERKQQSGEGIIFDGVRFLYPIVNRDHLGKNFRIQL